MEKALSLILALVLCLSLCACGHTDSSNNSVDTSSNDIHQHNYDKKNGLCECGTYASAGLLYELDSTNNGYIVIDVGACRDSEIIIPDCYNSLPVIGIGDSAFENCKKIISVSIPDGVVSIGHDAFEYCENLTNISIPNSVTKIGVGAFSKCTSLKEIVLPSGITNINSYTFYQCKALNRIEIPEGVTDIGGVSFAYCSNLTEIIIPDSVTTIEYGAFRNCGLSKITYKGSKKQWNAIELGDGWDDRNKSYTISCKDGNITK